MTALLLLAFIKILFKKIRIRILTRCQCVSPTGDANISDPVDFDQNDQFCLNGERLVLVSGIYGDSGSEYNTENGSVINIIAHGRLGNGPKYFEVIGKDGKVLYFGEDIDSRHYQSLNVNAYSDSVYSWKLDRTVDKYGNSITYTYYNDSFNGQHFISTINYSGYSLEFNYSDTVREDIIQGYLAPDTKYLINKLLQSVVVKFGVNTILN